jgi:hypothetical protein
MIILEIALVDYAKTNNLQDQAIAVCWIEIRLHKHFLKLQWKKIFVEQDMEISLLCAPPTNVIKSRRRLESPKETRQPMRAL